MSISPEMSSRQFPLKKLTRENFDNSRERSRVFYYDLVAKITAQGGETLSSVNELLQLPASQAFIVRRDDPMRIMSVLSGDGRVNLTRDPRLGDKPYANAIEWQADQRHGGLEQAFLEGHGQFEGLVTVAGYRKTDDLRVTKLSELANNLTDVDRRFSISVEGELSTENLAFLITRMPIDRFDVDDMTPSELERLENWQSDSKQVEFIYRAFLFPEHLEERLAA